MKRLNYMTWFITHKNHKQVYFCPFNKGLIIIFAFTLGV